MYKGLKVAVVIPAYNEEASIKQVVRDALAQSYAHESIVDAIVVCDNGSTDNTADLAKKACAKVVFEPKRGYGRACLRAIAALPAVDVVVFMDADCADDPCEINLLLEEIIGGSDLVIGSRSLGKQEKGAQPFQQRAGNWLLTRFIRILWRYPVTDLGPFRAIRKEALDGLSMSHPTFGWTVEMQLKAFTQQLKIIEVPVTYRQRIGYSKISGTLKGTVSAAIIIVATIIKLWWPYGPTKEDEH